MRTLVGVGRRYVPLFWRLFIPNATVLGVACVVLMVEPANGRVVALVGGLTVMVLVNLVLMRRAFAPLARLIALMRAVDPLRPGQRLSAPGPDSEVTLLTGAFNDMLDRLETERRESGRRAQSERERERRRLAAELHDEIGQSLTAQVLQLDRLARRAPDDLREEVVDARDAALTTVEEVRALASRLRPEALDTLGLVPALTNLVERLSERTGVRIARRLDRDLPQLSEDAELVIYRVAQESLTNALRHAGPCHVEVTLGCEDGCLVLRVSDDGVGLGNALASDGGTGVRGMRERAVLLGAELSIDGRPGGGTVVTLRVDE